MTKLTTAALITAAAASLGGCATTTGVVPIGDNVYTLGKDDPWAYTGTAARAEALREGAAFCAQQGKTFTLLDGKRSDYSGGFGSMFGSVSAPNVYGSASGSSGAIGSIASAEITFACR